jgi:predicted HAD superfamily Cof-like phosphohydrolase
VNRDLTAREMGELLEQSAKTAADRKAMAEEFVEDAHLETIEEAKRFAAGWIETAAGHAAGEAYYCEHSRLRDRVQEFHNAVGQPILAKPSVPSDERVRLRARLIAEEFFEVLEAMFSHADRNNIQDLHARVRGFIEGGWVQVDLPLLADGLADLDYVSEGTRLEFGIDGDPIAEEVHRANMAKTGAAKRADGKIEKPPGWTPPDVAGELRKQGWEA